MGPCVCWVLGAGWWVDFTNEDIGWFIGILIMDGLNLSPQILRKFWSQQQDTDQGNEFVHHNYRSHAARRFQMFCHFFGVQDPLIVPPLQEQCPNYKTNDFFNWLHHIWKEASILGPTVSANEQTCSMQGKLQYNTRCRKCKQNGDGIQTDAIADDGYTFDFYFRNEPVNTKWTRQSLLPMHAWLLHMF